MNNDLIMYVLVNKRLSKSQKIVQSSHAVAEFMHKNKTNIVSDWVSNHRTMVVLDVDESELEYIIETTKLNGVYFHDSDLKYKYTAIAFEPITRHTGKSLFNNLRLA